MLSVHLRTLEETIAFYEKLEGEIDNQRNLINTVTAELFQKWTGEQALEYTDYFSGLDAGVSINNYRKYPTNFNNLKDTWQEIYDALVAAHEVFCCQMNRCDGFLSALTDDGYVPIDESCQTRSVGGERLVANYDYIEQLVSRLGELIEDGPCDKKDGSQVQNWKAVRDSFSGCLRQSDFNPDTYSEEIIEEINNEFLHLGNFKDSLSTYSSRLQVLEGELIGVFGKQTSEFARGLDRTIYQVSSGTTVNKQRILYLSTKSPRVYTPEEVKEIKGLLDYSMKLPISINRDKIANAGNLRNMDFYCMMSQPDSELSRLFENYDLYLSRYEQDEETKMERERLVQYFLKTSSYFAEIEPVDYEDSWLQEETFFSNGKEKTIYLANCLLRNSPCNILNNMPYLVYDQEEGYSFISKEEYTPKYSLDEMANEEIDLLMKKKPAEIIAGNMAIKLAACTAIISTVQGEKSFKENFVKELPRSMKFSKGFQSGTVKAVSGIVCGIATAKDTADELIHVSEDLFFNKEFVNDYKTCYTEVINNQQKTNSYQGIGTQGVGNAGAIAFLMTESGQKISKMCSTYVDSVYKTLTEGTPYEQGELLGGITVEVALTAITGGEAVASKLATMKNVLKVTKGVKTAAKAAETAGDIADAAETAGNIAEAADTITDATEAEKALNALDEAYQTSETEKLFVDTPFDDTGNLKPNVKYQTGEFNYNYETDANGRISNWNTDNLQLTERESRLSHDPNTPGKLDGDHSGHLAGDRFGGSPELDNLVTQSQNVNLSQYKKIENQWANAINDGKEVTVNVNIKYDADGLRPTEFNVEYTIDGKYYSKDILN